MIDCGSGIGFIRPVARANNFNIACVPRGTGLADVIAYSRNSSARNRSATATHDSVSCALECRGILLPARFEVSEQIQEFVLRQHADEPGWHRRNLGGLALLNIRLLNLSAVAC